MTPCTSRQPFNSVLQRLSLFVMVLAVTACGPKPEGKTSAGSRLNVAADASAPAAFSLVDCQSRVLDGSPAVAVTFTQPLARLQDFKRLLQAKDADKPVSERWVLTDNPRVLMLANATPERQYDVQISADLSSSSGQKLALGQNCKVKVEAMANSFYFASKGVVLPAGQNGGLPVITVNTPEVDLQFLRINADALPRFLQQVGVQGGRPNNASEEDAQDREYGNEYDYINSGDRQIKGLVSRYRLDNLREMATSVYLGRFTTDPRKNRRNVSFLPVEHIKELQAPGIYVAVMNAPGEFRSDHQVTYFYVTDIGLHVRRHAAQTDVFTTSLKSGEALGRIELSLIDEAGKVLAQTATDAQGHAVFGGSTDTATKAARVLLARRDKEISVITLGDPALDLSEFDIDGQPSSELKLFVYAGRDLYRPGEEFNVSILARDADGQALNRLAPDTATAAPLTLVLKKPDGSPVSTQLVRPHEMSHGYYQARLNLPANAPTGRWLLEAKTDPGAQEPDAQWDFSVEEFLPERMKLLLSASEAPLQGQSPLVLKVQGDYLFGAPAAGNRLMGTLVTERQSFPLAQAWPGFIFGDVADDSSFKRQDLEEGVLNDEGSTEVEIPIDFAQRHSPMKVRASFSLLETGGRPVVRSIERTWWPAPQMVGLRPAFDRDVAPEGGLAEFELIRVNTQGQFSPGQDIAVRLVREERQWYWRYQDQGGWKSGYTVNDELIEARTVALNARSKLSLAVKWGRYRLELTDPQTGHTSRYHFYAGWGAQEADDVGNRPDRVQLKLEGAPFKGGDKAKLTITPPHDGEALLTVEGDRVLYQQRLKVRTQGTVVMLPVDAAWQRHDLYVTVVAFRPGSQGERITPARALGLVHLPLAREERKLKLALTVPAKSVPEQSVPVKVKLLDFAGLPLPASTKAIVTVSAVDVGILNITEYATPSPTDFFFGKQRFGADLLDHYGKLIESMQGNRAKQRFGGDAGLRDTQSLPRKVRLVDLFSGPVSVDAFGEATIPMLLPDFNGTLRLMAVASTDTSYASTQAEMQVAAPLVAELSMPRFIAAGDTATLALDVTNLSGSAQTVKVKIEAQSPLKITGAAAPVKLADKERTVLRFNAQASQAFGLAPIKLTLTAGAIKVVRTAALQVQPLTPQVREVRRARIEPAGSFKVNPNLVEGLWPESATVDVSLSDKPPIDIRNAVNGLLMYPYGCLEQTTSSAYPLVFIDEAAAKAYKINPLSREERAQRLQVAMERLMGMQKPSGGFGLWSADSPYEAWLSAYVTGFLQDTKDAGFAVPEDFYKKAMGSLSLEFQKASGYQLAPVTQCKGDEEMRRKCASSQAAQVREAHQRFAAAVHAGYILARQQAASLSTLRVLHDTYRQNARSPLPMLHLSLALKLMGDESRSQVALDEAMKLPWGLGLSASDDGHWGDWLGDYGSSLRDKALTYAFMHRHQLEHVQRESLMLDLSHDLDQRQYLSTQERLALFLAARAAGGGSGNAPWRATLNTADQAQTINGTATEQRSVTVAALKRGTSLTNTSSTPLFVEVAVQGYPLKPLAAKDDPIRIERTWWTVDGLKVSDQEFETGQMLIVRLRVQSKQRIKDGLVVDRIPAGMEIDNFNLMQGVDASAFAVENVNVAQAMKDKRIHHLEYRDDRFVVAADIEGAPLDLFYVLRVVTPGVYGVPAPFVEDMYRPELQGVGAAQGDITVVSPK